MIALLLATFLSSAHAQDKVLGLEVMFGIGGAWGSYTDPSTPLEHEAALPFVLQGYYAGVIPLGQAGPAIKVRTGVEAEVGPSLSKDEVHGRVRFSAGVGPAVHSDEVDIYVLGGIFTGFDTLLAHGLTGAQQWGWQLALGGRAGPFSLDLGIPVGGVGRTLWTRAMFRLPAALGVGLEFERYHQRDQDTIDNAQRIIALFGISI